MRKWNRIFQKIVKIFKKEDKECAAEKATKRANKEMARICDAILLGSSHRPKIGIICGSGLGGLAELLSQPDIFPYQDSQGFPRSTVEGHAGRFVLGELAGVPVIVMQGRFHFYEGYSMEMTTLPVRVMKLLGEESLVVTNAAGGVNDKYAVGDIILLKDHINLPGLSCQNPLTGPNNERFGPRFFSTNDLYNKQYREIAKTVADSLNLSHKMHEGVYAMVGGPNYETVAEVKMLKILGVDCVGMSTVPETIVAQHCGMKVVAASLICNICVREYDTGVSTNHQEVIEASVNHTKDMKELVAKIVQEISSLKVEIEEFGQDWFEKRVEYMGQGSPFEERKGDEKRIH